MKCLGFILCVTFCGCTCRFAAQDLSFSDAVRNSVREHGGHKCVAIDLEPDGSMFVAGRPIKLSELKDIISVPGIPTPVSVLIDVHRMANHEAIRNICDVCRSNGVEMVTVKGIFKGLDMRNSRGIP